MKFLVDHNVGRGVAHALQEAGHEAIFVGDVDPHMEDTAILTWAVREQRLLITQDHDFGALVYQSGASHAGVLLLRMGEARRAERIAVLRWILDNHAADLPGCFSVFENGRLRIRC
jgi:predicted nuclease of predicted toxin-antitoxin system